MSRFAAEVKDKKVRFVNLEDWQTIHELSIEDYFKARKADGAKTYIHNMKKNTHELGLYLIKEGYEPKRRSNSNSRGKTYYKTVINSGTDIFNITIHKETNSKTEKEFSFIDSKMNLNFKLEDLRETYDLKGEDVQVLAQALGNFFSKGYVKDTISSNALDMWLKMAPVKKGGVADADYCKKQFRNTKEQADFARKAFKGGWLHLTDDENKKDGKKGVSLDVNSLYPSIMYNELLPWGTPEEFEGEPFVADKRYKLGIQEVIFDYLILKPGKMPCAFHCGTFDFMDENRFIERSITPVYAVLTNVDLELIKDSYIYGDIQYLKGLKYRATNSLFRPYIDHFMEQKKTTDGLDRMEAKLFLNSLFGKFAQKTAYLEYSFRIDNEGVERAEATGAIIDASKTSTLSYPALSAFISSYSRAKVVKTANANYDRFIYADTDSLHLVFDDEEFESLLKVKNDFEMLKLTVENITEEIIVDEVNLGDWKIERIFDNSRFLWLKCYAEHDTKNGWKFVVAGLNKKDQDTLTADKFYQGSMIETTRERATPEGPVLVKEYFTLGQSVIGQAITTK